MERRVVDYIEFITFFSNLSTLPIKSDATRNKTSLGTRYSIPYHIRFKRQTLQLLTYTRYTRFINQDDHPPHTPMRR
jgi:hypothetical protein